MLRELYPVLALGSVIFRTIEAVFYTFGVVTLLSVVSLAQQAATASAADGTAQQAVSDSLVASHDQTGIAAVFAFVIGGLLYYIEPNRHCRV